MNLRRFALAVTALAVCVSTAFGASNVVISQVYGGAGCSGAGCSAYKNDYIELFNRGTSAVPLGGWSVQYASASGTSWQVTALPAFSLQPGQYFLVAESASTTGTNPLPTPDATGTILMSATAAKIALVNSATALSGGCPTGGSLVDLVGYGTANCFESAAAPAPSTSNAIFRALGGCSDADNNAADFSAAAASPRNSATAMHTCGSGNNPPVIIAPANPITGVSRDAAPFTVALTGADDRGVYNWSAAAGNGIDSVVVTGGQGTATATFTITLLMGFSGTATFNATLSDNVNAPATQIVNIAVVPPPDHIVISQIYGGGGNSNATFRNDYVQLHNPTATAVDVSGWSIQYASATGTTWTNIQPIGGVIGPNEYYLIALASGGNVGADLPAANISGSINMSATTGKVALVRNGAPLSSCSDTDVVDFVGYGTANCNEGNANAPASSNITALFRKNDGNADSNNNGADFTTGAPNPFRTTPLQELGPWVASTDPFLNVTNAPHDASITIDFSEPVDLDANWFSISCASGLHNDATVAHTNDFKEYVITPNTSFAFSEQCTVTITKTAVHDQDTDDSAPNTDTLADDFSWSFKVVDAGQPAPYAPDVHLTMGNPTNAAADVTQPDNFLIEKPTYALSYNRTKGTPNWVSWHLDNSWYGTLARNDTFRPDAEVPASWYRVQAFDFFSTGFDRGHMCPNADRDNQNRVPINQETYLMSNMVPQAPDNNQGPWSNLEQYLRTLTDPGDLEMYIVAGPAGVGGTGSNGFMTSVANGHVTVPAKTWKVALVLPKGDGDVSRVTAATRTIAVIMPNEQGIKTTDLNDWQKYLTTVDDVEKLCGCDLFSNVPAAIQNAIEAGVNGVNPPGAADMSAGTDEDTPKTLSLDVASPDANPLTYTIVSGPSHGALSGSGANRTYTPEADFNGSDAFTYNVSDGAKTSNTATVTIAVHEVNDLPRPSDDSESVEAGGTLKFAASDLLTNDTAGPENEANQTLSVTGVSSTTSTHGTVSLSNGVITFTPDVPYAGSASFAYTVCDDGVTNGLSDPLCATATVSVTVADNTPPSITDVVPSTKRLWPPSHQMVNISVTYSASDLGDPAPVCALRVRSNEAINGTGDGDTAPDWEIVDAHHVRLRAERAPSGPGRIYTITAACSDRAGNKSQNSATVAVPIDDAPQR